MQQLLRLLLLALLPLSALAANATIVPDQCETWSGRPNSGRCYYYASSTGTQTAMLSTCTSLPAAATVKGRLVDIRDAAETAFVGAMCKDNNYCMPHANLWSTSPSYLCCCNSAAVAANTDMGQTSTPGVSGTCSPASPTTCHTTPGPAVSASGRGKGECWIGAYKVVAQTNSPVQWSVVNSQGSVDNTVTYINWEPGSNIGTPSPQPSYFTTVGSGSTPAGISAIPSCAAVWTYTTAGNWILDYCDKPLPAVCVRDAACAGSYYKTKWYSVVAGVVNPGLCALCPVGQYRTYSISESTTSQTSCTDCPAGYYGAATSGGRNTSSCDGVCPQGTFWWVAATLPAAAAANLLTTHAARKHLARRSTAGPGSSATR
jgi:hypothetical protein